MFFTQIILYSYKCYNCNVEIGEDIMKILYFTATGNSLYVAKRIGDEYYSIPKII